jgi:hypothetical protein
MSAYRCEQRWDFDVWVMTCLLCGENLTPEGVWHVGSITRHMRDRHGLCFQTCDPVQHTVSQDGRDDGSWCRTVQVEHRADYGRGQRVLLVVRQFGMGLAAWKTAQERRASESRSKARRVRCQYYPTPPTRNARPEPVQRVLGHVRVGVTP